MPLPAAVVTIGGAARIGRTIYDYFTGGGTESGCQLVSPGDVSPFLAGRAAPWIVAERVEDLARAWGKPATREARDLGLTFEQAARMHLDEFVPLCEQLSGGARYRKQDEPGAMSDRNRAREAFVQLKAGQNALPAGPPAPGGLEGPAKAGAPAWLVPAVLAVLVGIVVAGRRG